MLKRIEKKPQEQSFTLIEVIISVGMLTAVVLQMVGGQGNVFGMIEYSQRSSEATWLAKRLMSQIEYFASYMDFKELENSTSIKDQPFKLDNQPSSTATADFDYLYSIEVKEWKLPLFDLLSSGGPKPEGEEEQEQWEDKQKSSNPADAAGFDGVINSVFEGQILKIAHVEVSWPEGAQRNSVTLAMLLTNQKKLDEYITTKKGIWDALKKKSAGAQPDKKPLIDPLTGQPIKEGETPGGSQLPSDTGGRTQPRQPNPTTGGSRGDTIDGNND